MIVATSIRAAAALPDTLDDRVWSARRSERCFSRNDGVGLLRRPRQSADPDVYLRIAATQTPKSDSDGVLWCAARYPDWPIERCRKWARKVSAQHCARDGCKG